jgi:hypothetical protein
MDHCQSEMKYHHQQYLWTILHHREKAERFCCIGVTNSERSVGTRMDVPHGRRLTAVPHARRMVPVHHVTKRTVLLHERMAVSYTRKSEVP